MTTIRDIQLIPLQYTMAQEKAYGMARGLTALRQASLIEVSADNGITGIGEAWGPCHISTAYLELIKPYYIGRSIFDHEQVWNLILAKHYHFGIQNQMIACLSGIDIALHDTIGKTLDLPVYQLLGGKARDWVPVYASGGYLTEDLDNQLGEQMRRLQGLGHTAVKIKVGIDPQSDQQRVERVREILGEDILLTVDVNGNYTLDTALESMRRTAPYRVHWYEEPLPPQDYAGYRQLRAQAAANIATGEALYSAYDFKRLLDLEGADIVQPDLTLCGGFSQGRQIAQLCRLYNVRLSPHVWGSAIGLAAAVQFVASLPPWPHTNHIPYPCLVEYDVGANALRDELLVEPIPYCDGHLRVSDRPGLGVSVDSAAVEHYRLR